MSVLHYGINLGTFESLTKVDINSRRANHRLVRRGFQALLLRHRIVLVKKHDQVESKLPMEHNTV